MASFPYSPKSLRADDFIANHEQILETLTYADAHANDIELCRSILDKARTNLHPSNDHGAIITRPRSISAACLPSIRKSMKK